MKRRTLYQHHLIAAVGSLMIRMNANCRVFELSIRKTTLLLEVSSYGGTYVVGRAVPGFIRRSEGHHRDFPGLHFFYKFHLLYKAGVERNKESPNSGFVFCISRML